MMYASARFKSVRHQGENVLDRTDYQILNILQKDCRRTLKQVGDQVGLTAPAVSERVRRMEERGIIRSFRAEVDRRQLDCNMSGFILVAVEPERYDRFCRFCQQQPAILTHSHVVGTYNALLYFAVRDTKELDALLACIKKYGNSHTAVELQTYFDSKEIPAPEAGKRVETWRQGVGCDEMQRKKNAKTRFE